MKQPITTGITLRVVADAVGVNLAILLAMTVRFWEVSWMSHGTPASTFSRAIFASLVETYLYSASILTPLILIVFYLSGFYTRGRAIWGAIDRL